CTGQLKPAKGGQLHRRLHFNKPILRLGEFIQNGAKAELLDIKEKHIHALQFNFKLYIALNFMLYSKKRISQSEAICINDYINICMDALPVFNENHAKKYLLECIQDYFLEENLPFIQYVQKLHKLLLLIRRERNGSSSPIVNFDEFIALHQEVSIN
ncbi:MAG: hypothetical protein ABI675_24250, partial [Chitinophagaceae bacterium]